MMPCSSQWAIRLRTTALGADERQPDEDLVDDVERHRLFETGLHLVLDLLEAPPRIESDDDAGQHLVSEVAPLGERRGQ
jgi:hypothetical protein